MKLEQARLEQENVNEKMLLELMQAANNLDEARLETELSERSLEQAEENMKVSGKQYEGDWKLFRIIWKHKCFGSRLIRRKWMPISNCM